MIEKAGIAATSIALPGSKPDSAGAPADLAKAAKAFEAVFLRQMIGTMRQASIGDSLFDSSATTQFREMADARTAESLADKGALGIAEMLLKQFEGHDAPPSRIAMGKAPLTSAKAPDA